jgi:hypothetical protein
MEKLKPVRPSSGSAAEKPKMDDGMVNDSLGTVNIADSPGSDPEKETGDAKSRNKSTRED